MPEKTLRGLNVHIYRCSLGNCTNGPSREGNKVLLVLESGTGPDYSNDPSRAFKLERRKKHVRAIPYNCDNPAPGRPCFSGNFIYSSDSRFPHDYPIPIHDRYE